MTFLENKFIFHLQLNIISYRSCVLHTWWKPHFVNTLILCDNTYKFNIYLEHNFVEWASAYSRDQFTFINEKQIKRSDSIESNEYFVQSVETPCCAWFLIFFFYLKNQMNWTALQWNRTKNLHKIKYITSVGWHIFTRSTFLNGNPMTNYFSR